MLLEQQSRKSSLSLSLAYLAHSIPNIPVPRWPCRVIVYDAKSEERVSLIIEHIPLQSLIMAFIHPRAYSIRSYIITLHRRKKKSRRAASRLMSRDNNLSWCANGVRLSYFSGNSRVTLLKQFYPTILCGRARRTRLPRGEFYLFVGRESPSGF